MVSGTRRARDENPTLALNMEDISLLSISCLTPVVIFGAVLSWIICCKRRRSSGRDVRTPTIFAARSGSNFRDNVNYVENGTFYDTDHREYMSTGMYALSTLHQQSTHVPQTPPPRYEDIELVPPPPTPRLNINEPQTPPPVYEDTILLTNLS